MDKVAALGCIVCRLYYGVHSPAAIHHMDGKTKTGAHFKVLGLCGNHHQIASPDGQWVTRHGPGRKAGKKVFEEEYDTEENLLIKTKELLEAE